MSPGRRHRRNAGFTRLATLWCALLMVGLPGCGPLFPAPGSPGTKPGQFGDEVFEQEPNDTFDTAQIITLGPEDAVTVYGRIEPLNDVDVFEIGSLTIGDRVIVDVGTPGSRLDASAAVFDEGGRLIFENDDRDLELQQLDPFINVVVRRDTDITFVAIASSPFAPGTGTYHMMIRVVRGGDAPAPEPQIVALNFSGGSVTIPNDRTYTVDPFDTADISAQYAGWTEGVRNEIVATVATNYAGLGLDLRVLPGATLPHNCSYSMILFGGRNPRAFGIAENVDPYNANPCDDGIVFTEMFTPTVFGRTLTVEELGRAIGNVASHEIGHLLGLHHVADIHDLMDNTGDATTFLLDQQFKASPLDRSVFPIGVQDGFLLLLETIGWASDLQ